MSLFVEFEDADALKSAFETLSEDGEVAMPLGDYGFSPLFATPFRLVSRPLRCLLAIKSENRCVLAGFASLTVIGFYALISAVSFILYAVDKSAAKRGALRISETTLHLSELFGGWPGALIAQRVFRHKTRKQPFQLIFWAASRSQHRGADLATVRR